MPVRRLRTLQEAEDSLFQDPDDPGLWSRIAALWDFSDRLAPKKSYPPGVHKHRSVEELNRQRDAWEAAALRDSLAR